MLVMSLKKTLSSLIGNTSVTCQACAAHNEALSWTFFLLPSIPSNYLNEKLSPELNVEITIATVLIAFWLCRARSRGESVLLLHADALCNPYHVSIPPSSSVRIWDCPSSEACLRQGTEAHTGYGSMKPPVLPTTKHLRLFKPMSRAADCITEELAYWPCK